MFTFLQQSQVSIKSTAICIQLQGKNMNSRILSHNFIG